MAFLAPLGAAVMGTGGAGAAGAGAAGAGAGAAGTAGAAGAGAGMAGGAGSSIAGLTGAEAGAGAGGAGMAGSSLGSAGAAGGGAGGSSGMLSSLMPSKSTIMQSMGPLSSMMQPPPMAKPGPTAGSKPGAPLSSALPPAPQIVGGGNPLGNSSFGGLNFGNSGSVSSQQDLLQLIQRLRGGMGNGILG